MNWIYLGIPFTDPNDYKKDFIGPPVAFVYEITINETGEKYIGKKSLQTKTKDWPKYHSSSKAIKKYVKQHGIDSISRKILHLCYRQGDATYLELKEQLHVDALRNPKYLNGYIRAQVSSTHLTPCNTY